MGALKVSGHVQSGQLLRLYTGLVDHLAPQGRFLSKIFGRLGPRGCPRLERDILQYRAHLFLVENRHDVAIDLLRNRCRSSRGCRKPKPGLLLEAQRKHNIDLSRSFVVGDRWRDIDAGHSAGCKTILIDYGYKERKPEQPPEATVRSLREAADWIISSTLKESHSFEGVSQSR